MKSSGVASGGDKSMEMSNWFLCSMFSDRSDRWMDGEMLLLMEGVENEGEIVVPPASELGCEWKGVEGCVVEAVLSAIVRLLYLCASPDASRKFVASPGERRGLLSYLSPPIDFSNFGELRLRKGWEVEGEEQVRELRWVVGWSAEK